MPASRTKSPLAPWREPQTPAAMENSRANAPVEQKKNLAGTTGIAAGSFKLHSTLQKRE